MSYIGAEPTTAAFPFDQFSGNGTTTAFTLTYAPASTTSIVVAISGVLQNPNLYSVVGTTLTFSPAPPTGTNNISVLYLGLPVIGGSSPGNTAFLSATDITATAGQTIFASAGSYTPGFVQVYRNGVRLGNADFTATNGTTITLAVGAVSGDLITIEYYTLTSLTNALPLTGGTVTGSTTFNSTVTVNGASASGFTGMKNRIINGNMTIDQRNAGASVVVGSGAFPVDRWFSVEDTDGALTAEQVEDVPAGFVNSVKITTTTADSSLTTTQTAQFMQMIEGFNVSDLGFGSASAQTVTLSFWVKSSLTGTMGGSVRNDSANRSYPFSYTISAANTWEQKSITIAGDTTGTWLTNNGIGLRLVFSLGCGPSRLGTAGAWNANNNTGPTGEVPVIGTLNATWYITGVQLERGSNATSFEFIDYGRQLIQCQRYFTKFQTDGTGFAGIAVGTQGATTESIFAIGFPVQMRVEPTCAISNLDVSDVVTYGVDATLGGFFAGYQMGQIRVTHSSAGAQFRPATLNVKNNTTGFLSLSAEL